MVLLLDPRLQVHLPAPLPVLLVQAVPVPVTMVLVLEVDLVLVVAVVMMMAVMLVVALMMTVLLLLLHLSLLLGDPVLLLELKSVGDVGRILPLLALMLGVKSSVGVLEVRVDVGIERNVVVGGGEVGVEFDNGGVMPEREGGGEAGWGKRGREDVSFARERRSEEPDLRLGSRCTKSIRPASSELPHSLERVRTKLWSYQAQREGGGGGRKGSRREGGSRLTARRLP